MVSPPGSPAIPEAVQRLHQYHCISIPLFSALTKLQKQPATTGGEHHLVHGLSDHPSWGRQSPQLTPTPSPSPSPSHNSHAIRTSHLHLPSPSGADGYAPPIATPPDSLRQSVTYASMSPPDTTVVRRPRRLRVSMHFPHTMLMRSRARECRAQESQFWELDASGRRARRLGDR
ncbi:hypothetical protein EK21DRAFT_105611 [Setomelanomma holmii]|uniref:Uncharacterized protein n=1 Tax=Setomelanomma holmii TaxID=210430 RepID=A0A9P4GVL0_9PLEO|nr:hypothetical protein EK21DRAFT_105611 [Setomelanomma holmii]